MEEGDVRNFCSHRWLLRPSRSVLGPKRLIYFFMNNIINLKGNCVLRTLKNSFAIFWAWRTYTHTHIHTHIHTYIHTRLGLINSLKGSYLKRPKCKPLGNPQSFMNQVIRKKKYCFPPHRFHFTPAIPSADYYSLLSIFVKYKLQI